MASSSSSAAMAQWHRIEALVQAWLDERQQLIVLLCALQGIRGLSRSDMPRQQQLQHFCELLMTTSAQAISRYIASWSTKPAISIARTRG